MPNATPLAGRTVSRAVLACALLALTPAPAAAFGTLAGRGEIEVVESFPAETLLDLPDLRQAADVWPDMIASATQTLDIEVFYFSENPGQDDALDRTLAAVEAAARRGVRVRALQDAGFDRTYPEIGARIGALPGAQRRKLDARTLWGGVQHAKLFVVDGTEFFLGSQNWDWRALAHIREAGVRVRSARLAEAIERIFALDWALAAGEAEPVAATPAACADSLVTAAGDTVSALLAASPARALPAGVPWDWPLLEAMIDSAHASVRLQLLSYDPSESGGGYWDDLDAALRRAAARGVRVQILLSNWAKRQSSLPWILSLAAAPNVAVRFTNIPPAAAGHIPYARVEHCKYLLADDRACWIGTANGSRDYFHSSRNVSLLVRGRSHNGVSVALGALFARSWDGPYAEVVSSCGLYTPPRIGE